MDLVIDQVLRPRMAYLKGVVAPILGLPHDDARVLHTVMSVQSQLHAAMANPFSNRLLPDFLKTRTELEAFTEHIVAFVLGGINALKRV